MTAPLGAHVSIAGGLGKAFERGEALDCDAIQIFVKNASRWQAPPLDEGVVVDFRSCHQASPIGPLIAHASYLINLAAVDETVHRRSLAALADELTRCTALGVEGLVLHPGAHLGEGEEAGLETIARSLDAVLAEQPEGSTRVLLENTAGQGTVLGYRLEQLERIVEIADHGDQLGVCLDTCHAFAGGYELTTRDGYEAFVEEVTERLGLDRVGAFHLNDSKHPLGSRKDRHENIGEGHLGLEPFERLVHDPRWAQVPMVIETPTGEDDGGHDRDLQRLRTL